MFCSRVSASKIYRSTVLSLLVLLTVGCASSNGPLTKVESHEATPAIDYEMVGIPLLYQGFGSSVPLTRDLSLTAAHVAKLNWDNVIAYHPQCDIAIVKSNNSGALLPDLGLVYTNENITTYGKDGTGNLLKGEGKYRLDLNFANHSYFKHCQASVTDAPIREGMSGGGAFNSRGELVGIISAMASSNTRLANGEKLPYDRLSLFVSLNQVRGWLNQTVSNYYGTNELVLNWGTPSNEQLANNLQ
ncbi:serine protease [Vibrio zhugei]|uniref:Serine protease n=1 Tax=Vibrio zhugei TaxID=2479546 RepID=A0ABV7CAX9_9VIBR|nr:serine protease [Vibrio zhugei]